MKGITLSEHIRQSKIAVTANKIKGNRHGQILSMLYADPYHFIEEILQNTEDACRNIPDFEGKGILRLVIHDDAINIYHNGKPFSEKDLMSISTFASTSKKGNPEINMIGKFGIGFRSVYGISENPEIHSEKHHYRILDYEVLETCENRSTHEFTTLIRLPFKKDLDKNIIISTKERLLTLDHTLLLFLSHLHKIDIKSGAQRLSIVRKNTELQKDTFHSSLQTSGLKNISERFLLFRKNTHNSKECAIAFKQGEAADIFSSCNNSAVSVYFPTQYKLKHAFLIHGRFTTNPTREQIIFNTKYCPENFKLNEELGDLLFKSMKFLRKEKILNSSFFALFDWNIQNIDPLHEKIEKTIDKFLGDEKSLKNETNQYKDCKSLCIPEHKILREFVSRKEIFNIWTRFDFIHSEYLSDQSFIQYLRKKHKLKNADLDSLAFHIRQHPEFLKKKKFEELNLLYELLTEYPKYWDIKHADRYYSLRQSPIIPNSKKDLKAPYHKGGRPAIFLGEIRGKVPLVHPEIAALSESRNFFAMLGIPESSPGLSNAEKLIHGIRLHNANPTLFKLFLLFTDGNSTLKERISTLLSNTRCIRSLLSQTGEKELNKPTDVYIRKKELELFFGAKNVAFVAPDLYRYFETNEIHKKELNEFLIALGVHELPAKIQLKKSLSEVQRKVLRADIEIHPIVKETVVDFSIDGLDEFLSFPNFEASKSLWHILNTMPDDYLEASYTFESYVRSETTNFSPHFIQVLKKTAFLYNQNLTAKHCAEISIGEMHADYNNTGLRTKILQILGIDETLETSLSQKEEELIRYIRESGKDPKDFMVSTNDAEESALFFTNYSPSKEESLSDTQIDISQSGLLAKSLPFHGEYKPDQEALEDILGDATLKIKEHLLQNVYANSKSINIEIESSGILKILDKRQLLSMAFIGNSNGSPYIMMHPMLEELLQERENRKDIILFIVRGNTCIKVEAEHVNHFVLNNTLLTLKRMKFTR